MNRRELVKGGLLASLITPIVNALGLAKQKPVEADESLFIPRTRMFWPRKWYKVVATGEIVSGDKIRLFLDDPQPPYPLYARFENGEATTYTAKELVPVL